MWNPSCNDEKERTPQECILLIGSTGVGKSAHIRLLTGNARVEVSKGARSCTKETKIFSDGKDRAYIDTVGAEDSRNLSDGKVLNDTQRYLHKQKVKKIKIIWILNPNERNTSTIQTQAKYIQSISKNVWKSVIVILKKPGYDLEGSSQGVKEAIKENGGRTLVENIPIIGYDNLDWIDKPPNIPDAEMRKKLGFYKSNEIKELICSKLNRLSDCDLGFVEKTCQRCNLKGDPRFCSDYPCHLESKKTHGKRSGFKHRSNEILQEPVTTTERKSGCPRDCTSSYQRCYYHSESWLSTWHCRGCGANIYEGSYFYHCNSCCHRSSHNSPYVLACSGMYHESCGGPRDVSSTSYKQVHKCCGEIYGVGGCAEWCLSCDKALETEGCKTICKGCEKDWGKLPGCTNGQKHEFK